MLAQAAWWVGRQDTADAGHDPNPGLALLQLAKGDLQAAADSIRNALENPHGGSFEAPSSSDLQRASLLPKQVEIASAVGDLDTARVAVVELGTDRRDLWGGGHSGIRRVGARVGPAGGRAGREAQQSFRRSASIWAELDAPYENARARLGLADAYRAAGNEGRALRMAW